MILVECGFRYKLTNVFLQNSYDHVYSSNDNTTVMAVSEWMNEWMNLFPWQKNKTISQAGTPKHDNCVRLPVSWVTVQLRVLLYWLRS